MGPAGFSFPPPPPPPPPRPANTSSTHDAPAPYDSFRGRGGRGSGAPHRGRGRGGNQRGDRGSHGNNIRLGGSQRGGSGGFGQPGPYGPRPPITNNTPSQYGFQGPSLHQSQPGYNNKPAFNQPHTPHFPHPRDAYGSHSYPSPHEASSTAGYPPPVNMPHHGQPSNAPRPPQAMGPPMRWGFEQPPSAGAFPGGSPHLNFSTQDFRSKSITHQPHGRHGGPRPYVPHSGGGAMSKQPAKRLHDTAFVPQLQNNVTLPPTSLPTPILNSLPSKPPATVASTRKSKKPRRTYNQLGLTPTADEHESSDADADADIDEEAKLAQVSGELKITYKGQTSTLQSATDISTWIEERRKRFPTKERVEERKKEAEKRKAAHEAKRAEEEGLRRKKIAEREDNKKLKLKENRAKKEAQKLERKSLPEQDINPADAAAKAKLKAEKLRRKLMKEEKKVAKAEADAEKAEKIAEALKVAQQNGAGGGDQKSENAIDTVAGTNLQGELGISDLEKQGEGGQQQPPSPSEMNSKPVAATEQVSGMDNNSAGVSSCDTSDISDETSSSGSDSSSVDSDSDSAPEEATSKRLRPDRVLPPPRQDNQQNKKPCHQFVKTGHCRRGVKCKFSHETQAGLDKARNAVAKGQVPESNRPKGLFQRLVMRQKEEEDRRIMQAISWLGEKGLLEEPVARNDLKMESTTAHSSVDTDV